MSYFYCLNRVQEDRDLSRAAAERYLMLQAFNANRSTPGRRPASRRVASAWSAFWATSPARAES